MVRENAMQLGGWAHRAGTDTVDWDGTALGHDELEEDENDSSVDVSLAGAGKEEVCPYAPGEKSDVSWREAVWSNTME